MANIRYKVGDTWYDVGSMGGSISEITVDSQLSDTSANPVENRVITKALEDSKEVSVSTDTPTGDEVLWINPDGTGGGSSSGGGGKLYRHVVAVQPGDLYSGELIFINQEQNSLIVNGTYIKNAQSFIRGTYNEYKSDGSLDTYIVTEVGTSSSAPNTILYLVGTTNKTDASGTFMSDTVTEL